MLTDEETESFYEIQDESPTFGVVDDGRKYPAVTARKRQQNGSRRETIYTVSKKGAYAHLYDEFERNVIEPYRDRKRKRANSGGDSRVNSANTTPSRVITPSKERKDERSYIGFPVNSVDR